MKRPFVIDDFFSALFFLSTIHFPIKVDFHATRIKKYFPVVGLFLGFLVASFDAIFSRVLSSPVVSFLDVLVLILLTGGLHLDGVGDAADGIFSGKSREKALEIMKDSRVGIMGVLAVIAVIGIKWGGIFDISSHRFLALCVIPAYSRTSMLFGMRFLPYCREEGTAKNFFESKKILPTLPLFIPVLFLSLWLKDGAVVLNGVFLLFTFLILFFYKRRLGCITGDTLGAMCEIVEAILFLSLAMVL